MTINEILETIIQQNLKLAELLDNTNNEDIEEIGKDINKIKEDVTKLNSILSQTINNDTNLTLQEKYNKLNALGEEYNNLYAIANKIKTFFESKDIADDTINTWKEIEEFLAGIKDSENLLTLIQNINSNIKNNSDDIAILQGKLIIIETGAKIVISGTPDVIYKNTTTNITLNATFRSTDTSLIPDTIIIKDGNEELINAINNKTTKVVVPLNLANNGKSFSVECYIDPNKTGNLTKIVSSCLINARYPIYYGFGKTPEDVLNIINKHNPKTSINGTYTKISTEDEVKFYIISGTDIIKANNFTMGGAPYVMNYSTKQINGVTRHIYESGAVYNTGAEVKVVVS